MPGKKLNRAVAPVRQPTDMDVAWIAGLYEGEGTCWGDSKGRIMAGIYQKDPEILFWCREMFGGNISQNRHKTPDKICNIWNLGGDNARAFLQVIYPFMSSRRKMQIEKTSFKKFTGVVRNTRPDIGEDRKAARSVMTTEQRKVESQQYWRSQNQEKYRTYQHFYDNKLRGKKVSEVIQ